MDKEKFICLFNRYLNDGFKNMDIELNNGSTITFNKKCMLYRFLGGEFQISTSGLLIQIDYRIIKSIAI